MPGATIGPKNTVFDLKIDDFRKVVDLNLMGTVIPSIVLPNIWLKKILLMVDLTLLVFNNK